MADEKAHAPGSPARILAWVFFFSGFASLIYQVAWQRALTLYYGVGAVSVTLIVSVYMLGLGLGALAGGWLAERAERKIFLYLVVELGIGVFGLFSMSLLATLGRASAGASPFISGLASFAFLCPPTLLMGITLPLLVKIFNRWLKDFLKTVSFLYFLNTLGAALGSLFASYFLISLFGLDRAVFFAAFLNFALCGLIFLALRREGEERSPAPASSGLSSFSSASRGPMTLGSFAYPLVFLSGFLAIGWELLWFRVCGVLVKASPYAFSTVLSVYLFGIALGSFMMERFLAGRSGLRGFGLFCLLQFLAGLSSFFLIAGFYHLSRETGFGSLTAASFVQEVHPWIPSSRIPGSLRAFVVLDVFLWPLWFEFIPAVFFGACFPLLSRLALSRADREGMTTGGVYFMNTMGNLAGGLVAGLVLLPFAGTENTAPLFAAGGLLFGLFMNPSQNKRLKPGFRALFVALCFFGLFWFFPGRGELYKAVHIRPGADYEIYFEEGLDGVVMTYRRGESVVNYINGLGHGGRPGPYFMVKTLEAIALAPSVDEVLVIGYGTGSIVETLLACPEVRKITLVEINHALIKNLTKMELFSRMLSDPRVELVLDDGRRFLLRTRKRFDLALMDPLRSTTAYSNNLYSLEFFRLVKSRLKPEGVLAVSTDKMKVIDKTLAEAFPYVVEYNLGYAMETCIASPSAFRGKDQTRVNRILAALPEHIRAGVERAAANSMMVADRKLIIARARGLPINRDFRPVSEFYLGLALRERFF